MVRALERAPVSIAPPAPAPRLAWGQALLAVAAGFLLAVAMLGPWQPRSVAPASLPPLEPIARLAAASGPVEVRTASQAEFFNCAPAAPIARDSIVRTGPTAQCEIGLEDGNALRLDCNTEVTLHQSKVVEVSRGRLWSTSRPDGKGLEIQSGGGTIVAGPAARLALDCQPQAVRLMVVDGAVNVQTGQQSIEAGPGKQVRIIQGKLEAEPHRRDVLLETGWVNSVLALGGSEHPELVERVNRLLASVGAAKLSLLYEDELRRLGDGGVPPLLAYLASTRGTPNVAPRATAARIVADVAQSRWIADLIALLTDANVDVRFHAARGLERLTGRDQGCQARAWQSEPWSSCEGAHRKWLAWWAENRDRYPAARRDIPAPTPPSL
jgi:ferric-dicitrate binding protein FerR (iron transport regulator)